MEIPLKSAPEIGWRRPLVQTVDELAVAVQDGFARRSQADLVGDPLGSPVVGMDEGDEVTEAQVFARMAQHGADGFAGDAAAPMGPSQAPGERGAARQMTAAEAALAEEARTVAPFDRPAPMGWLAVNDIRADLRAMGLRMRRSAHEAAHLGIGIHRQDGVDIVER